MIEKALLLQQNEWWVLLKKAGIEKTIGFDTLGCSRISDNEIACAIVSLTARGLIESWQNALKISDKLKPYVAGLKRGKFVATSRRYRDTYPVSCIYISDNEVLRVEIDRGKDKRIKLRMYDIDEFLAEETGYEFMPDKECELSDEYEYYIADTENWEKGFRDDGSLMLFYNIYDSCSCRQLLKVFVKRDSLCDIVLCEYPDGRQVIKGYSKEILAEILKGTA